MESLEHQRFERKYFITEAQAAQIRKIVGSNLIPDEFSAQQPALAYPVHSLYLDSADLFTYWATLRCQKTRFKLRVRFYDDHPDAPLFFEIKRRENECVLKQRGIVRRSAGPLLLAGQLPGRQHLVADRPEWLAALQRFCHLMHRLNARLVVHVSYLREAWVNPAASSVRVTIDRQVRGEAQREPRFAKHMTNPIQPFGEQLILELKFTDRFPRWFSDLVQHFNLVQCGAPKYCGSVAQTGEDRVLNGKRRPVEALERLTVEPASQAEASTPERLDASTVQVFNGLAAEQFS